MLLRASIDSVFQDLWTWTAPPNVLLCCYDRYTWASRTLHILRALIGTIWQPGLLYNNKYSAWFSVTLQAFLYVCLIWLCMRNKVPMSAISNKKASHTEFKLILNTFKPDGCYVCYPPIEFTDEVLHTKSHTVLSCCLEPYFSSCGYSNRKGCLLLLK